MFVFPVSSSLQRRTLRGANFPRVFAGVPGSRATAASPADAVRVPPLDIVEADGSYTATLDMPGIAKDQFSISIEGRRVDVSTTAAPQGDSTAGARQLHRERAAPRYARSFVLPGELEPGAAQAKLDNGVLTMTLPKRLANGAAQIKVEPD